MPYPNTTYLICYKHNLMYTTCINYRDFINLNPGDGRDGAVVAIS